MLRIVLIKFCLLLGITAPGQPGDKKDSLLAALSAADQQKEQMPVLVQLAEMSISEKKFREATGYYQQAISLDLEGIADTMVLRLYAGLAEVYMKQNLTQHDSVRIMVEKGLELSEQEGISKYIARFLHYQGSYFLAKDQYPEATKYLFRALKIYQELDELKAMADLCELIANCYTNMYRPEESLKYTLEAIRLLKKEAHLYPSKIAHLSVGIGVGYAQNKIPDSALIYLDAAKKLYRELGMKAPVWAMAYTFSSYGDAYKVIASHNETDSMARARHYDSSLMYYKLSIEEWERLHKENRYPVSPEVIPYLRLYMASVYCRLQKISLAKDEFMAAKKIIESAGSRRDMLQVYYISYKISEAEGRYREAMDQYKQWVTLKDSFAGRDMLLKIEAYRNEFAFYEKEKKLELIAAQNKLKASRQKQRRNFAYMLSGLVLVSSGYGIYRYRRINKQKMEQRRLKERLAISQDLHDQVGSTLSSIAVYSKVAQVEGEKGNTEKMNELLDRIRDTSGKIMTEMGDIVWAINPQNDTMEKIILRMESFTRPLLAARNMQFRFHYDKADRIPELEMEQRKNFFLIFKEAVNNAIKYSGASLLETSISYRQGMLELIVTDNGVGFNIDKEMSDTRTLSGNGLKNMYARAREMNANLQIGSAIGKGTNIKLILPVS